MHTVQFSFLLVMYASLVAQTVKNSLAMLETQVQSLGWEDPPEKGMATHSRILPGKCHGHGQSMGYSRWNTRDC